MTYNTVPHPSSSQARRNGTTPDHTSLHQDDQQAHDREPSSRCLSDSLMEPQAVLSHSSHPPVTCKVVSIYA